MTSSMATPIRLLPIHGFAKTLIIVPTLFAAMLTLLTGCNGAATSTIDPLLATPSRITVSTIRFDTIGKVLASDGRPLYVFSPDHHQEVTCTGACWGTWPPLISADPPQVVGGLDASAFGRADSPGLAEGTGVVTFHGWPLYGYAGDTGSPAKVARGQRLFLNGGPWYLIAPSGQIITANGNKAPGSAP